MYFITARWHGSSAGRASIPTCRERRPQAIPRLPSTTVPVWDNVALIKRPIKVNQFMTTLDIPLRFVTKDESSRRPNDILFGIKPKTSVGNAQHEQMGTDSYGRGVSGMRRKWQYGLLANPGMISYLLNIRFALRFRVDLSSISSDAAMCSMLPQQKLSASPPTLP